MHTYKKKQQNNVKILVAKTAIIMAKEVWDSVYLSGLYGTFNRYFTKAYYVQVLEGEAPTLKYSLV